MRWEMHVGYTEVTGSARKSSVGKHKKRFIRRHAL